MMRLLPSISELGRALGLAGALLLPLGAQATWSIAALNPDTGTIAVAGASCSYLVYGIAQVLPGKGVVAREMRRGSPWPDDLRMAEALMRALNAGALAGGDSRCKGSNSSTAFISLHKKSDPANVPWLTLAIFGLEAGRQSALPPLQHLFEQWLQRDTGNPSTRSFIVPAAR